MGYAVGKDAGKQLGEFVGCYIGVMCVKGAYIEIRGKQDGSGFILRKTRQVAVNA